MSARQTPNAPRVLAAELREARDLFLAALADVDPALLGAPGLSGEWSARELVAHLGYWAGHAAEALHYAAEGRADEFGEAEMDVDERNAIVARVAAETDLATTRKREQAAFDALLAALGEIDPTVLADRVAYGDTIEQVVRDDGPDHYREHALDIRAWFTGENDEDDFDADELDDAGEADGDDD
ncbi:MAG TPA: maleylpyruvate isomerase N-terminal domain-containing protein [Candidatus Limnocylindria bacterium]|nr:maleylpyruvate isomerase N-terminal domain-containing protein [Candidatus Limnocylindria bacterium]